MKKLTKNITSVTINVNFGGKAYEINNLFDSNVKVQREDIMILKVLVENMGQALCDKIEKEIEND